jgi:hypothetical protein
MELLNNIFMMSRMSELFEVDIEEFERYLQALDYGAEELEEILKTNNYLETEILQEVHHLRDLFHRIKAIYELIETKAEKYRPNNIILHQSLKEVDDPLKKIEFIIAKIWHDSKYVPGYIERGLYIDLEAVRGYIKDIENILGSAIRREAFI